MKQNLALVLSGGGSKGALQVGALRALCELGIQPDLLVGTSIGAVNTAFLALHGFNEDSLDQMAEIWAHVKYENLLPSNYIWLAVRSLFGRSSSEPSRMIRDFFIRHGITENLSFGKLPQPRLVIVTSDINTGEPILNGMKPDEKVLDALLLSTALPPWVMPVQRQGRTLMDGAVVSNLPIEPALQAGAQEIIALDLMDLRPTPGLENGLGRLVDRITAAVEKRQTDLELLLAAARGVSVFHIPLISDKPIPFWDFQHTDELIEQGYQQARQAIASWQFAQNESGERWLSYNVENIDECAAEITR